MDRSCRTCAFWGDGFQNESGFCYSEGDYKDADDFCDFWQEKPVCVSESAPVSKKAWKALATYKSPRDRRHLVILSNWPPIGEHWTYRRYMEAFKSQGAVGVSEKDKEG